MGGFAWKGASREPVRNSRGPLMRWLLRQLHDLLAYWLLPFACFALPVSLGNRLARFVARRGWFYNDRIDQALRNASEVLSIGDPERWKAQLRLLRLLDAIDVWHGRFSSDKRIAEKLVVDPPAWPEESSLVVLGSHVGLGALLLRRLASAGYRPRLIYRDLPPGGNRQAPVFYAYMAWRVAYMKRMGDGGGIAVPGGRERYEAALEEPGAAIVLLVDAPSNRPRGTSLRLWGHRLEVDARGLGMAVAAHARACHFSMYWDAQRQRRVIGLTAVRTLQTEQSALADSGDWLEELVEQHPEQWQLWLTLKPVLARED